MTENERVISIVGLPGSGKTTYLAALWHLIRNDPDVVTKLRFESLKIGNYEHLNGIAKQWRAAKEQIRTQVNGTRTVSMSLLDVHGASLRVTFPDAPGEEYSRMWEEREVDRDLAETFSVEGILLLINGDKIAFPAWIAAETAVRLAAGISPDGRDAVDWHPKFAPTQVQIVDLLQQLRKPPLDVGPRRLAILISAWDQLIDEEKEPQDYLATKLPLVDQYLRSGRDGWTWYVWGTSAQGGEYDDPEKDEKKEEAARLRSMDEPSRRIMLVDGVTKSNDLTEPLEWLMK
jgi:hypothetical protein